MNKTKKLVIKVLVSIVLIGIVVWKVDTDAVLLNIKLLDWRIAPLVIFFLILNYILSGIRWKSLLVHKGSEKATIPYLVNLYFVGAFFNNFMPTSIGGDGYKIYKLGQKIGNTTDSFTATFITLRFYNVIIFMIVNENSKAGFVVFCIPENESINCVFIIYRIYICNIFSNSKRDRKNKHNHAYKSK